MISPSAARPDGSASSASTLVSAASGSISASRRLASTASASARERHRPLRPRSFIVRFGGGRRRFDEADVRRSPTLRQADWPPRRRPRRALVLQRRPSAPSGAGLLGLRRILDLGSLRLVVRFDVGFRFVRGSSTRPAPAAPRCLRPAPVLEQPQQPRSPVARRLGLASANRRRGVAWPGGPGSAAWARRPRGFSGIAARRIGARHAGADDAEGAARHEFPQQHDRRCRSGARRSPRRSPSCVFFGKDGSPAARRAR